MERAEKLRKEGAGLDAIVEDYQRRKAMTEQQLEQKTPEEMNKAIHVSNQQMRMPRTQSDGAAEDMSD